MTRLTDGNRTITITLAIWEDGSGLSPDWSNDFFEIGSLDYDEEKDAYIVSDVDYCVDYALDWKYSRGDFADDIPNENNTVLVDGVEIE